VTEEAGFSRIETSGGQGVVAGEGNIQINYIPPAPVPEARLGPQMPGVFSPDVVADEVQEMTEFDVAKLFGAASAAYVSDVLRVLIERGNTDKELAVAVLGLMRPDKAREFITPLLGEYPWLQPTTDDTAGDGPAALPEGQANDTVVVAARVGWPEYEAAGAYICWPGQGFWQKVTHIGFYADGEIKPVIARVRAWHEEILLTTAEAAARRAAGDIGLAAALEFFLAQGTKDEHEYYSIILLSRFDDSDTVHLTAPIANDLVSGSGRATGWTQRFRYTSLAKLTSGSARTSRLDV
jgi:hypothetical protein